MAGGAIYNDSQTYGNGLVTLQGTFSDSGTTITVLHGKGFTVARGGTFAGCYKVVLASGVKGLHSVQADVATVNTIASATVVHPGFAATSDLAADTQTFYIYTYNFAGTQVTLVATTSCTFAVVGSLSALNP